MFDEVKAFLKLSSIQELLSDDDLQQIYRLWQRQGGVPKILTTFFIINNIEPLNYVLYVPEGCFSGMAIREVDLSDKNIDMIGAGAFEYDEELTDIDLGNVKYIGIGAFNSCSKLKHVTIPPSLDSIDEEAFSNTSIDELHIPKTLRRIGLKAFSEIDTLSKVTTDCTIKEFIHICTVPPKFIFYGDKNLKEIICIDGKLPLDN